MAKQTFTVGQVLTAAQVTALQTNEYNQTVSVKTASYTLVAADVGTRIEMNSGSATTVTVNTALFSAGDTLVIQNKGAGVSTVTAGTATVSTSGSLALAQYDQGTLYFVSTGVAIFFNATAGAADIPKSLLTTNGDMIYATGASTPVRLGIGSAAQVLTVAGGIPSWATPAAASSGLNLISTTAITGASTYSFNSCFTSTYTNYLVILNSTTNVQFNNIYMRMRASGTDNTSSQYKWAGYYQPFLSTASINAQNSNGLVGDGLRLGSFGGANGFTHVQVYSPQASEVTSSVAFNTNNYGTNDGYTSQAISAMSVATSYDGFTIYASSAGNFAGSVSIYGYGK